MDQIKKESHMNLFTSENHNNKVIYKIYYMLPYEHIPYENYIKILSKKYHLLQNLLDKYNIKTIFLNLNIFTNRLKDDKLLRYKEYYNYIFSDEVLKKNYLLDNLQMCDFLIVDLGEKNLSGSKNIHLEKIILSCFYTKDILGKEVILLLNKENETEFFSNLKMTINGLQIYKIYNYVYLPDIILQYHFKIVQILEKNKFILRKE